jgi:hypothetical protein
MIGMKLTGWKKVLTDWEIQKLLEILYRIFSKVYNTSKIQSAENLFFSSEEKQFSNNVLPRNTNVMA